MASTWLPAAVIADVRAVARVFYVDRKMTRNWNTTRRENELRLLTGWAWVSLDGSRERQGFKTQSVCFRDAWYCLISQSDVPQVKRKRVFKGTIRLGHLGRAEEIAA